MGAVTLVTVRPPQNAQNDAPGFPTSQAPGSRTSSRPAAGAPTAPCLVATTSTHLDGLPPCGNCSNHAFCASKLRFMVISVSTLATFPLTKLHSLYISKKIEKGSLKKDVEFNRQPFKGNKTSRITNVASWYLKHRQISSLGTSITSVTELGLFRGLNGCHPRTSDLSMTTSS